MTKTNSKWENERLRRKSFGLPLISKREYEGEQKTLRQTLIFKNDIYDRIKEYVKINHGYSSRELVKTDLWKDYLTCLNQIREFADKKVKITYRRTSDFLRGGGEKVGRIKLEGEKIKFYEGKKRTKYFFLDAGVYEGWFAVLIPIIIETI